MPFGSKYIVSMSFLKFPRKKFVVDAEKASLALSMQNFPFMFYRINTETSLTTAN